mgnify:CR=1
MFDQNVFFREIIEKRKYDLGEYSSNHLPYYAFLCDEEARTRDFPAIQNPAFLNG